MRREVIRRTLPPHTPAGMVELFTTPRQKEANFVKSTLRKNEIKYRSREEMREHGWRFCIYVPSRSRNKAARIVGDALDEEDNRQSPEGHGASWD